MDGMSVSAKGKQQKQVRQIQCQEQCIEHILYYLSGDLKDVSGEKSIYVQRYFLFVNVVGNFFISVNFYFFSVFGYGNVC